MEAREFEIIFATEPLTDPADERIDRAMDAIPGTVVASYGDLTIVTIIVPATSAVEAGLAAAAILKDAGIDVVRTYPDLVSRQDIADRTGLTRQAVGHWVRGERHDGNFPTPVSLVSGGAWLWHDVVEWLRKHNHEIESTEYPTLDEHNRLDVMLTGLARSPWVSTMFAVSADVHFASAHSVVTRFAADSHRVEYSLAS